MKNTITKIQKWYRKRNLIFNDEETKKLESDIKQIKEMAETAAERERRENDRRELDANSICPACHQKSTIVNKIRNVQGEGHVSGSFNLGFGDVSGSSSINTGPVNHCNNCGNEWGKVDYKYIYRDDIIARWIYYILISIEGKYSFGDNVKQMMIEKNFYAESFYLLSLDDDISYKIREDQLWTKLEDIRTEFPTIFRSVYE